MFSQSNRTRDNMNTEFKKSFAVCRQFQSKEELTETVKSFGKKYNVIFSIKSSSLKQGKFAYICKHGGLKRELEKNSAGIEKQESIEGAETMKKEVKRSTQKFDCPASFNLFDFAITRSNMEHNHPISQDNTTYAVNRKQPPEIMERIYTLLASGHKDPVTSVMDTLKALNVTNIIKKDIHNIQTLFLKNENGKEMFLLISYLESIGYTVRIQVETKGDMQEVKGIFFIHHAAIQEARIWPEAVTIDAIYKTNAHKLSLVNVVGTSNASSNKGSNKLQTFAIAAAFVNSETEATYTWILEELREAIWPTNEHPLPSVFVTDNEQALRNAIDAIFPESQHLLCSWHLWNTMATKLPIGTIDSAEYNLRRAQAELDFKAIMSSFDEASYKEALGSFEQLITTHGYFKNNGSLALRYLKDVLLQDDEVKHWVGMYANDHPHMGNRTSGRAESFHSGLKRALDSQSASKLTLTVKRMNAYYEQKRANRYRKLNVERISIDSVLFDREKEFRFKHLAFKVVIFAMDKIRTNTITSLQSDFVSRGANCKCWDRIRYKLPCPCIIAASPEVLPLDIVDMRWRFEHDENFEEKKENVPLSCVVEPDLESK